MRKFTLILTGLLLACVGAFAQIKGTVVSDEDGEPVIGASIMVKGTTVGTISDVDGTFEISASAGDVLVVSYIGMATQEVPAANGMVISLQSSATELDEVMAVAYGTGTKKSFTGSATVVKSEQIEKKNPSEVSKALAGEVAGVQVVTTSGQPGTSASIRIRGIGSVNSSTAPLYVVDGVPYDGDVSAIDPGDIASTTVLKDATATSLYGSRGANGVILITTKKGTVGGEAKIDIDVKYGGNMRLLPLYDVIKSPEEYMELGWQGLYNELRPGYTTANAAAQAACAGLFGAKGIPTGYNMWNTTDLIDPYTGKFYANVKRKPGYETLESWEDAIFRIGQKAEATVKIHGGADKTTYYTSFGYLKDEGYYIGSDYSRFSARANVDHQAKKWLKGGLNMSYSYSILNNPGQEGDGTMNNGFKYINGIPPIYPVYQRNEDGSLKEDTQIGGYAYDYGMYEGYGRGFGSGINPAGAVRLDKQKTEQHQFAGTAFLEVKFYEDLKLTANVGYQYLGYTQSRLTNSYYGDAAGVGRILKQYVTYMSLTANQLLEYNKLIDDHSIRVLAGHETNMLIQSVASGNKHYIALPDNLEWSNAIQTDMIESSTSKATIDSYLATVNYNYAERYFINGSYRADGSSRFAKGHRWGHFGSIGAAWVITNEGFMDNTKDWLRNLKLRASWGVLGNQNIGLYLYEDQYAIENVDGQLGYVWTYKGNPELTWERTSTVDVGLEFEFGKYVSGEIEYYYKLTDNLLFPRYVAPSLGYSYYYVNDGKLSNQGVEFQLNVHAVDTRNVKLDIRLNGGHYTNRVEEMPREANGERMQMNGQWSQGHSLYDWYLPEYAGVSEDGKALYVGYYEPSKGAFGEKNSTTGEINYITSVHKYELDFEAKNGRAPVLGQDYDTISTTNYAYAGSNYVGKSASPALQGGFGFDLDVYGVELSAQFSYGIGGYGYDNVYATLMHSGRIGSNNWHTDIRNAWTETNTKTDVPRLSNGTDNYANAASTRFLTSNSYLNLNNVRLGYKFPKKWMDKIKVNTLSLWISADNLFIVSARKGYNPMASYDGSSSDSQYTPLSTIMGGIKIQF